MIMMRQPTIGGSTTLSLSRWATTTRRADSARKQNRPTGTNHMEGGLLAIQHTTQREWSAERKKITEREVVQLYRLQHTDTEIIIEFSFFFCLIFHQGFLCVSMCAGDVVSTCA
jgi:hypothetical protein